MGCEGFLSGAARLVRSRNDGANRPPRPGGRSLERVFPGWRRLEGSSQTGQTPWAFLRGPLMKLIAGNSNTRLSEAIGKRLATQLTSADIRTFKDGEIFVKIEDNVRGEDVFVIQSTSAPANDNLMELLICIDALCARLGEPHHGGASPISAMRGRTGRSAGARRSRPSSWPI